MLNEYLLQHECNKVDRYRKTQEYHECQILRRKINGQQNEYSAYFT